MSFLSFLVLHGFTAQAAGDPHVNVRHTYKSKWMWVPTGTVLGAGLGGALITGNNCPVTQSWRGRRYCDSASEQLGHAATADRGHAINQPAGASGHHCVAVLRANQSTVSGSNDMKKMIQLACRYWLAGLLLKLLMTTRCSAHRRTRRRPHQCSISEQCQLSIGQFSRIQNVLNIQPVVPIHVSKDWLVISLITPVVYQ
jgi:hypothetical protein